MNLRRATAADVPGIAAAHVASWQAAYRGLLPDAVLDNLSIAERQAMWASRPVGQRGFWITETNGEVSGFVSAGPSRETSLPAPEFAEIFAIYVRAEAWDTGCGHALCSAAFDDMRQASAQTALVWVLAGNSRARRFYARAGFVADGATKDLTLHGVTLPELRYRREL